MRSLQYLHTMYCRRLRRRSRRLTRESHGEPVDLRHLRHTLDAPAVCAAHARASRLLQGYRSPRNVTQAFGAKFKLTHVERDDGLARSHADYGDRRTSVAVLKYGVSRLKQLSL